MRRMTAIAAALFCAATASASATQYPERVKSYLSEAAKLCAEHGGKPGRPNEKTVRLIDVNDDGRDDFVIDYRHFPCDGGAPDIFCAEGFCGIDVLSWRSDNEWKLFLHASVADWRVRKGDKPAVLLLQRGSFCGRPKQRQCTVVYTFRKGAMHGKFQDAKYFRTAK